MSNTIKFAEAVKIFSQILPIVRGIDLEKPITVDLEGTPEALRAVVSPEELTGVESMLPLLIPQAINQTEEPKLKEMRKLFTEHVLLTNIPPQWQTHYDLLHKLLNERLEQVQVRE